MHSKSPALADVRAATRAAAPHDKCCVKRPRINMRCVAAAQCLQLHLERAVPGATQCSHSRSRPKSGGAVSSMHFRPWVVAHERHNQDWVVRRGAVKPCSTYTHAAQPHEAAHQHSASTHACIDTDTCAAKTKRRAQPAQPVRVGSRLTRQCAMAQAGLRDATTAIQIKKQRERLEGRQKIQAAVKNAAPWHNQAGAERLHDTPPSCAQHNASSTHASCVHAFLPLLAPLRHRKIHAGLTAAQQMHAVTSLQPRSEARLLGRGGLHQQPCKWTSAASWLLLQPARADRCRCCCAC